MIVILSLNFLTGAALGARCKVYILAPAIGFAVLGAAIVAAQRGDQFWSLIPVIILTGMAIQLGYLVGALAAHRVVQAECKPPRIKIGKGNDQSATPTATELVRRETAA
jgi:hypothetical protein